MRRVEPFADVVPGEKPVPWAAEHPSHMPSPFVSRFPAMSASPFIEPSLTPDMDTTPQVSAEEVIGNVLFPSPTSSAEISEAGDKGAEGPQTSAEEIKGDNNPIPSLSPSTEADQGGTNSSDGPQPSFGQAAGDVSPSVPSEEQGEDSSSGRSCFPGASTVELAGGKRKRMQELRVGDQVRVSDGTFSTVFMFTHANAEYVGTNYVHLVASGNFALTAAKGHLVYVCHGVEKCDKAVVRVEDVRIGDGIYAGRMDVVRTVSDIRIVGGKGLFNPHTLYGDLVVDGIVCSCYTAFVDLGLAHGALAPLRAVWQSWGLRLLAIVESIRERSLKVLN